MRNKRNQSVLILGAGLAGLAAGYELVKAGFEVTIVEKEEAVGGLARTIEVNGFRFDTGPHRWYTKNDMVNNWMLKLLGHEVTKVPRQTRIYFDHKFFNYPIKIKDTLLGMGLWLTFRAVVDYALVRFQQLFIKNEPVTLEEGFVSQFGRTLYEIFFKRYSEKLWGTSCKNIAADWIGQRTRGLNIVTIIKNALFSSQKIVSFVDEFAYPKKGIGRIAEKMAEEIVQAGGKILVNSQVTEIFHKNNVIISVSLNDNEKFEVAADQVVSTIPLSEVVAFLKPKAPLEIANVNSKLTYRDQIQVALFINKTHLTSDTWIYVHSLELPFVRVMEMDNWNADLSPKGTTSLVFEVTCNEGDSVWLMSDVEIVDMVTQSFIKEFNLISKQDLLGSYVHRAPKEYPVYHIGYKKDVAKIKDFLQQFKNLQLIGRNGIFRYNNMDHSIEMGLFAAWNIIEGERKFDIEEVNIEREYLEEKKIFGKEFELPEDQHVEELH